MVSCLPDKRAPGGAPFLVRVFAGGVCLRGELRLWRRDGRERFGQRHPGKRKSKLFQWCKEVPRAQAASAIELFTGVNKAGICAHTRTSRARTIAHFPPFVLYLLKKERGDTMSEPNIQIREVADCMQHWRKNCGEWVSKIWKRVSECRRPGMNI